MTSFAIISASFIAIYLYTLPSDFSFILLVGVKDYSKWPTIPQVFIGGEFIGGCDVMLEMHKNGELIEELKKVGIRSVLLDRIEQEEKEK